MKAKVLRAYLRAEDRVRSFLREERGATDFIAIILIILAVVAIAAIFKNRLIDIVNELMDRILENIDP